MSWLVDTPFVFVLNLYNKATILKRLCVFEYFEISTTGGSFSKGTTWNTGDIVSTSDKVQYNYLLKAIFAFYSKKLCICNSLKEIPLVRRSIELSSDFAQEIWAQWLSVKEELILRISWTRLTKICFAFNHCILPRLT